MVLVSPQFLHQNLFYFIYLHPEGRVEDRIFLNFFGKTTCILGPKGLLVAKECTLERPSNILKQPYILKIEQSHQSFVFRE
jgi:hypothetical protein